MQFHTLNVKDVLDALKTNINGLTNEEATKRLQDFGLNQLKEKERRSAIAQFIDQFKDFMIILLIVASIISGIIGDIVDTIAILVIVLINAVIGFVQEFKAEKAMESLKKMSASFATVVRNGSHEKIDASQLVPGDIVLIEAGNIVPADMRLVETAQLKIDESALTGESMAIDKDAMLVVEEDSPLGDRKNMAYKGTIVSYGRGMGVVVATGMSTEIGKIARLIQEDEGLKTPLQKRLSDFGVKLSISVILVCSLLFTVGLLRGEPVVLMFMTALTLVVAAVPEALPAVVTISLAMAAKIMVKQNALIRKLPAVETLGSVTYICSDKTGTLTQNKMTVRDVFVEDRLIETSTMDSIPKSPTFDTFITALSISNDASIDPEGNLIGDPTETAMLTLSERLGFRKNDISVRLKRVAEIPFDSERKAMTTIHMAEGIDAALEIQKMDNQVLYPYISITKGAFDGIIQNSTSIIKNGIPQPLDAQALIEINERMASSGLRVICVACRLWKEIPQNISPEVVEKDMAILGLVGIIDPPRPEAAASVAVCKSAGIKTVMITGDHPSTAKYIAQSIGIIEKDEGVLTGKDLSRLKEEEFQKVVKDVSVYARVAPEQKLKIVKALQSQGQYVAMTGDGVNDAPALKAADIGVAMGITGTDVSKQASDMILLDDNFATIVRAVKEGRRVFDGILKMIRYILSTNAGEIMLIFFSPLLGLPLPLLPIHMLWLNLFTDGLPSLAFAVGPAEPDVMNRPPRDPKTGILTGGMVVKILWTGFLLASIGIVMQAISVDYLPKEKWQTMLFTFMCFAELGAALSLISEKQSFFSLRFRDMKYMLAAILLTIVLQMAVIYMPVMNPIFKTVPLSFSELVITCLLSTSLFFAIEIEKLVKFNILKRG
ncbi:MAG: cation-translocating P-type ATPase [Thermodesulfovibrionales bacterium]|nr:cation-translocating P-type ATPase [Thermodesulfovibrionales bacterium]